jgi:hypothetical protein
MTDRKTYMREYMRRRRVSSANSADVNSTYMQFTEQLREVIRQEVEQAIQPLLVQLTKLTVNSVNNGIPPALEHTAPPAAAPPTLPPERAAALRRRAKTCGLNWAEIAQRFNAEGIPTLSGGQWDGASVAKL